MKHTNEPKSLVRLSTLLMAILSQTGFSQRKEKCYKNDHDKC